MPDPVLIRLDEPSVTAMGGIWPLVPVWRSFPSGPRPRWTPSARSRVTDLAFSWRASTSLVSRDCTPSSPGTRWRFWWSTPKACGW